MKLIDKDSLMGIMNCNKPLADGYHMKDYVFEQILHDIDNEPTIDAIPVEWIEKWEEEQTGGEYSFELITDLLENWRKENETNNI